MKFSMLGSVLGLLIAFQSAAFAAEDSRDDDVKGERTILFRVSETAGIRRRFDVVSAHLQISPAAPADTTFALMQDGKPVSRQLTTHRNNSGQIDAITVDFVADLDPLTARTYELKYGPSTKTAKEPSPGFGLTESADAFEISNRGRVVWTVRKDLRGLFRFRRSPDEQFVQADSRGLVFQTGDGKHHRLADRKPTATRVTRNGPLVCAVEFEFDDWPTDSKSKVELEFVRTKSWAKATWSVSGTPDDSKVVTNMGAELMLELTGKETLIDFGANDFVYTTVRKNETALFQAQPPEASKGQPPWIVSRGKIGELRRQVVAPPGNVSSGVAGWAHVMGETRCTAIAVDGFGRRDHDRIEVVGDGKLAVSRSFNITQGDSAIVPKTLRFWVHFVSVPVHIGARTSPQSMRSPLKVERLKPKKLDETQTRVKFEKIRLTDRYYCDGIDAGDINGDGQLDAIAGPVWYEGPEFAKAHAFYKPVPLPPEASPSNSMFSFVHDFSGDDKPDILVLGRVHKHAAYWYENPGETDAPWQKHFAFERVRGESPALVSMRGDESRQVISHWNGRWGWIEPLESDPRKPWAFKAIGDDEGWPQFYHGEGVGDINNDGRRDLIINDGWYEQPSQSSGQWTLHRNKFAKGRGGAQMFAYDVDGDGDRDVITALDGHGWGLAWFEQTTTDDGRIHFRERKIMGDRNEEQRFGVAFSQPHALAIADIDGDGLKDIVCGKRMWAHGPKGDVEPNADPVLYWFQLVRGSEGAIHFRPHRIDNRSGVGVQITVKDINADGRPDILTASKLGAFVFLNQQDPSLVR